MSSFLIIFLYNHLKIGFVGCQISKRYCIGQKKTDCEKIEPLFYYCHKFYWNFNVFDPHKKWLFFLIIDFLIKFH